MPKQRQKKDALQEIEKFLKWFLNLNVLKLSLVFVVFIALYLISIELLFQQYSDHLYKIHATDREQYKNLIHILQQSGLVLLIILNIEWILQFYIHGKQFIFELAHIINGMICSVALIVNCSFQGNREVEIIIGLLMLRLIRLMYSIYDVTNQFDENKYEELELKFQKYESQCEKEIELRRQLDLDIVQLKTEIELIKEDKLNVQKKLNQIIN